MIYGATVGHGYYPLRTIGWLAGLFLVAAVLGITQPQQFTPTDPGKAIAAATATKTPGASSGTGTTTPADPPSLTGATPCPEDLGAYPCFTPWTYALQTVIPPASTLTTPTWQPHGWMLAAITTLKTASWALLALLLAGITGLLRRT